MPLLNMCLYTSSGVEDKAAYENYHFMFFQELEDPLIVGKVPTYVFHPNFKKPFIVEYFFTFLKFLYTFMNQRPQIPFFASFGIMLLNPNDVVIPKLKRVTTSAGSESCFELPKFGYNNFKI
jgi:hypothetical protein